MRHTPVSQDQTKMDLTTSNRKRAQSDPCDKEQVKTQRLHSSIIRIGSTEDGAYATVVADGGDSISDSPIPPGQSRRSSNSSSVFASDSPDSSVQVHPSDSPSSPVHIHISPSSPTNSVSTQEALLINCDETPTQPQLSVPAAEFNNLFNLVRVLVSDNHILKQQVLEISSKLDHLTGAVTQSNEPTAQVSSQTRDIWVSPSQPMDLCISTPEPTVLGASRPPPPSYHSHYKQAVQQNPLTRQPPRHHQQPADIEQLKVKVVPNWGRRFAFRRREYKNMDKNLKRAQIYEQFLNEEGGVYIVKKSRPKFAKNIQDYKLAESLSIHEMRTQVERWKVYAGESKHKFEDVDNQLYNLITKHNVVGERDVLLNKWSEEVRSAENKAQVMNQKELEFIYNLPNTDPYSGFIASASDHRPNNRGFYKKDFYRGGRPRNTNAHHGNRPATSHTPAAVKPNAPTFVSPWTSNTVTPFTPSNQVNTAIFQMPGHV